MLLFCLYARGKRKSCTIARGRVSTKSARGKLPTRASFSSREPCITLDYLFLQRARSRTSQCPGRSLAWVGICSDFPVASRTEKQCYVFTGARASSKRKVKNGWNGLASRSPQKKKKKSLLNRQSRNEYFPRDENFETNREDWAPSTDGAHAIVQVSQSHPFVVPTFTKIDQSEPFVVPRFLRIVF